MEDQILGSHPRRELTSNLDLEGLRHPEPGLPQGNPDGHIGGAHPGGKGAKGPGCDGMGVGADDHIPRPGVLLRNNLVTNPRTHIGEDAARLLRELAQEDVIVGQLLPGARGGMIDEQDRPLGARGPDHVQLLQLPDGQGACAVLGQGHIDGADDHLPRPHRAPHLPAQNLFC